MKAAGVIAEYDPFHSGHSYHLHEIRRITGADCIVAVMSGSFTQRGQHCFFSVGDRVRMAVGGGADLVLELPYIYACGSAADFAEGGTGILDGIGADFISFGCEAENADLLIKTSEALSDSEDNAEFAGALQKRLSGGMSYPKAFTAAVDEIYGSGAADVLRRPNNLLGCEYIKALGKLGSNMNIVPVRRVSSSHNDSMLSASAVRSAVYNCKGRCQDIRAYLENVIPIDNLVFFDDIEGMRNSYINIEKELFRMLQYRIMTADADELRRVYSVDEGLEHRLKKFAGGAADFHELVTAVKSKRYTYARISRTLCHILINLKKEDLDMLKGTYCARILGFSDAGRQYLKKCGDRIKIPLFSNLRRFNKIDEKIRKILEFDVRVGKITKLAEGRPDLTDEWKMLVPHMRDDDKR